MWFRSYYLILILLQIIPARQLTLPSEVWPQPLLTLLCSPVQIQTTTSPRWCHQAVPSTPQTTYQQTTRRNPPCRSPPPILPGSLRHQNHHWLQTLPWHLVHLPRRNLTTQTARRTGVRNILSSKRTNLNDFFKKTSTPIKILWRGWPRTLESPRAESE